MVDSVNALGDNLRIKHRMRNLNDLRAMSTFRLNEDQRDSHLAVDATKDGAQQVHLLDNVGFAINVDSVRDVLCASQHLGIRWPPSPQTHIGMLDLCEPMRDATGE